MPGRKDSGSLQSQVHPQNGFELTEILTNAPIGIFTSTPTGRFIYANPAMARLYGYETPDELIDSITDIGTQLYFDPMERLRFQRLLESSGEVVNYEYQFRHRDGSPRWISTNARTLTDRNGTVLYYQGFTTEISDRKRAQTELEANRRILEDAERLAGLGRWEWDMATDTWTLSENSLHLHGFDETRLTGLELLENVHRDDRALVKRTLIQAAKTGRPFESEYRILHKKTGEIRCLKAYGTMDHDVSEKFPKVKGISIDLTEMKGAEDALRHKHSLLQGIIESSSDAIFSLDRECRYTSFNQAHAREMKELYNADIQPGQSFFAHEAVKADRGKTQPDLDRALRGERFVKETHSGSPGCPGKFLQVNHNPIFDDNGRIIGLSLFSHDITERKQAEESLQKSEERYRLLFEHAPLGIFHIDQNGIITTCNDTFVKIIGSSHEALIGLDINRLPDTTIVNALQGALKGKADLYEGMYHPITAPGSAIFVKVYFAPLVDWKQKVVGCMGIVEDMTATAKSENEREDLQNQLIQAQKLESVGRLAGGVAHDFNNMLSVIHGHAEMGMEKVMSWHPLHRDLVTIRDTARRSTAIVRQLLAFARKQRISPRVLDLNETVGNMLTMIHRLIGEDIDLSWQPEKSLWPVEMDPAQVDQIVANLCVNARDAIAGVGKLTIETKNVRVDNDHATHNNDANPGEYVVLVVSDNGHGMDNDVRANIFEPFFTTRDIGQGTGLGLATVYGIVRQNNGFINVSSEPGHGSCFRIHFPRHIGKAGKNIKDGAPPMSRGNQETILVVEDDLLILDLAQKMLASLGYTVLTANSPRQAIEAANKHPDRIHLLLTDVVMPGMSGRDLANRLREARSDLRVLYMSGYTADIIANRGVIDKGLNFIQKPFNISDLSARIREILETTHPIDTTREQFSGH